MNHQNYQILASDRFKGEIIPVGFLTAFFFWEWLDLKDFCSDTFEQFDLVPAGAPPFSREAFEYFAESFDFGDFTDSFLMIFPDLYEPDYSKDFWS